MSMFKNPGRIPSTNIIESNDKQFINQQEKDDISQISLIKQKVDNVTFSVSLINETLDITNNKITLSHTPVSNKLIHNLIMIVEDLPNDEILIHHEIIDNFIITNREIDLGSFSGLKAMVSYITL